MSKKKLQDLFFIIENNPEMKQTFDDACTMLFNIGGRCYKEDLDNDIMECIKSTCYNSESDVEKHVGILANCGLTMGLIFYDCWRRINESKI